MMMVMVTISASINKTASPPGGYVGGGLQMQTDLAIDPAGNVWVMNNWQDIDSCFGTPPESLSTRCGGQGVTIFYGMAKPVRAPQIGPARRPENCALSRVNVRFGSLADIVTSPCHVRFAPNNGR
jgi:hypothetical protein